MRRSNDGFTLLEIVLTLSLMMVLVAYGAGVFTDMMNYYRSRGSAETLLWDLRRAQEAARARGKGAIHGLKFYSGHIRPDGTIDASPNLFSYLVYGYNVSTGTSPPEDTLAALDDDERAQVVNLSSTVRVVVDATVANPVNVGTGRRFQFCSETAGGAIVLDGSSDPTQIDLFDAAVGYFRIVFWNRQYCALQYRPL